jgi:DNA ligase-1
MELMKPWDVIDEMEWNNSRTHKEAVVEREAKRGNDAFFHGCRWALDSTITFGVRQVDEKKGNGKGFGPEAFWKVAEQLSTRELSGNAAQVAINYLLLNANEREWNFWYRRILIKDLRCGISEKTINKMVEPVNGDYVIPVFSCQLAHDGANHESKVSGKKFIEAKLDGVRVITIVYPSGHIDMYSRNGKELVNFPHVKEQLSKNAIFFKDPMVLDGEVMSSSFQDLMKQVHRKSDVKANDAVLNLFDIMSLEDFKRGRCDIPQYERSNALQIWYEPIKNHLPNIAVLSNEMVDLDTEDGQKRFGDINAQAIAGGYEGIMIKDPLAVYETKRSVAWLKQKPFIEVTLEVKSVEEGTGKNVGRLGALVCEGQDDGKSIAVNVGSGLTDDMRNSIWADSSSVIGQLVEVRADAVTQNQDGTYSLRFPRFKGFRGFEPGEKL